MYEEIEVLKKKNRKEKRNQRVGTWQWIEWLVQCRGYLPIILQ
jgi:hypothetical protein